MLEGARRRYQVGAAETDNQDRWQRAELAFAAVSSSHAHVNELVREIVAEELERLDDDRLTLVTIVSVDVEADLRHASVFYDTLDGEAADDDTLAALGEARVRLQGAIGRQAHLKRTPELSF